MAPKAGNATGSPTVRNAAAPLAHRVAGALAALEAKATRRDLENLTRFGITATRAIGVSMANIRLIARPIGRDHELALGLWADGLYEARMLATLVDDPKLVTPSQMDAWCRDFDNWAICDTACFALFDQTPHAFLKAKTWAGRKGEYQRRAAFALLASAALHRKQDGDEPYLEGLSLIEAASDDGRNFVKKGVNWALRGIGGRASPTLRRAARETAARLAAGPAATARWIGKDALRAFAKADAKAKTGRLG